MESGNKTQTAYVKLEIGGKVRVGGTQLTIWKDHMAGRWWMLTEKETENCSVALEKKSMRSKQCVQNSIWEVILVL